MKENIYYSELFDLYSLLLTDKQRLYFKEYFFENLLLEEISENEGISKNAVSKEIKRVKDLLEYYENALKLHEKRVKLYKRISDDKILKEIENILYK